ncbi:MAG: prolyl oligopeptidase family serine peptidase [Candidatus Obscuribacterales bacterium]|nr:prolyl oligopeptidase family serine peptidase [Candidatus Obscuribacterales bacterium]
MKKKSLILALAVAQSTFGFYWTSSVQAAQEDAVLKPGDNMVVDNVPSPPLSLVNAIDQYTNFRKASISSWHPVKREMLIETRFADTPQVHYLKMPAGARTQLTFSKENSHGAQFQPVDGNYFVFETDKGGDEFFQKFTYSMQDKSVKLFTDGKSRNTGGVWSEDGTKFAYGSTRRNGQDVDIYVVDPAKPGSDKLLCQLQGGGWEAKDWSPDGKTLLVANTIAATDGELWLIDTASGGKSQFAPEAGKHNISYGDAQFSKDGKGIYTACTHDSEFMQLAFIDLVSKKYIYLTKDIPWDVDQFKLSHDGKTIAVIINEDGLTGLHVYKTVDGSELAVPKLPTGQISQIEWHKNNQDLGFCLENSRTPSDIYSLNIASGKIDRWTESETGLVDTSKFSEPRLVHWKSFDDKSISGFLYMPNNVSGKHPVIINIHGGPESQFRPRYLGANNYIINELGVAMIYPNVRGSSGYGKTFLDADNGFKREGAYKDIGALLDWIKEQPDLDPDRVMVYGGSYGGNMSLACAMLYSDRLRCSLDIVGPSNIVTYLEHTQAYRRDLRRVEYGDERDPAMRAFLEKIAPAKNVDKIKKPLYVVQGKNDPRIPASESENMVAELKKTGTPVWFLMANDEGHGFGKKKNNDFFIYTSVEFIKQYLLQ